MQIDIWSDIVCPWCYVGKRRFERALAAFPHRADVKVVHRSFELDRNAPKIPKPRLEVLSAKYRWTEAQARAREAQMVATAAAEGLDFHLEGTMVGNTAKAHALVHFANQHGKADAMIERLYRAFFGESRSVFAVESLVALAAEVGLDPEGARRALEADVHADAVAADEREAHALGITGVPFFVIDGKYGISGAQPTELFAQVLAQVWAESHPIVAIGTSDEAAACGDEGCEIPAPRRTGS